MIHPKNYLLRGESASSQATAGALSRDFVQCLAMLMGLSSAGLFGMIPTAVAQDSSSQIEEIVVTATKRETSLLETPLAVSVISEDTIDKRHLVGMEDYLAGMPGVSYQDRGAGSNTITIRGISIGSQLDPNSPVGSYFGEVPVTGLGPPLNGNQAGNSDIKLVDIQRVEVLRGPQGTLYGSGPMGGTVRVIPNAPNLQAVEGTLAAEYSNTGEGGHNYMGQAMVNAPLIEDELGLRLVAYRFDNDGWIDNVPVSHPTPQVTAAVDAGSFAEDRENIGGDTYTGVRATGLWRPTDDFSVTLMHMYQGLFQDGHREVQTSLPGDYLQSRVNVGVIGQDTEYVNLELDITNLVLEYDLPGWGSFLNSTAFVNTEGASDIELSFFGPPFVGSGALNKNEKELLVNETRFASEFDGPFQFLAGLYYEDRSVTSDISIRWTGIPPTPPGNFSQKVDSENVQTQTAAFGEISFSPFDPLTLTLGARYYKFDQEVVRSRSTNLALRQFDVVGESEGRTSEIDGVISKVNVGYKLSDELFAYAQWAQGFREPRFQGAFDDPEFDVDNDGLIEFADGIEREVTEGLLDPDNVDNYEAGIKLQSSGGRLQGSLTGFLTDWTGIPVVPSLTAHLGAAAYFNAGDAESQGIEFQAVAEVIDDLSLEFSASWVEAQLTESIPGLGDAGDDLPGSADYNVSAALEKRFVVGGHEAFLRGNYTYISEYFGLISATGTPAGDYDLFDISGGVSIDNVLVGFFVKNLTDANDFTWVDNVFDRGRAYRLRPRTVGVSATVSF